MPISPSCSKPATALIRTGVVRTALVIGAELISPFMDWADRNVAVLFGDGAAAVVLEATDREEGLIAEKLGCYADDRETLRVQGKGGTYANRGVLYGVTRWQFEGQEIFKRAVQGMAAAADNTLTRVGLTPEAVDLGAARRVATDAGFWRRLELLRTPGALGRQNGAAA